MAQNQNSIISRLRDGFDLGDAQRNPGMDALRGLVALMVCSFHLSESGCFVFPLHWNQAGALRVNFFFTLSGFLLASVVIRPSQFDPKAFLTSRARRILPPYYTALLVCLLLVSVSDYVRYGPGFAVKDIGLHFLGMHAWWKDTATSLMGPYWTMTHEISFYLLLAALGLQIRRQHGWLVPVGMILVGFFIRYAKYKSWWEVPYSNPLLALDQFGVGTLAAMLVKRIPSRICWLLFCIGIALVLRSLWVMHEVAEPLVAKGISEHKLTSLTMEAFYKKKSNHLFFHLLCAFGVACVLVFMHKYPGFFGWLRYTPLPFFGKISYSLYLYHMPVALCFLRGLRAAPEGSAWQDPGFRFWMIMTGSTVYAAWAYWQFERPYILSKKLASRRQA